MLLSFDGKVRHHPPHPHFMLQFPWVSLPLFLYYKYTLHFEVLLGLESIFNKYTYLLNSLGNPSKLVLYET